MVKKGSIFKRMFGKKTVDRSKSPSKPGHSATATATKTKKPAPAAKGPDIKAQRGGVKVEPETPKIPKTPVRPEILPTDEKVKDAGTTRFEVITEKLSQQEEASVKISQGLKGLSSLLGDIDERLQEQSKTSNELVTTVKTIPEMMKDLPESSRAGLELLNTISVIMDQQSQGVQDLNSKVSNFSKVVTDLGDKLESDAKERTGEVQLFNKSLGSVKETMSAISEQQSKVNEKHATNIKEMATTLKKSSDDQQQRVDNIIARMKVMNGLVIFLIIVIILGLVAVVLSL